MMTGAKAKGTLTAAQRTKNRQRLLKDELMVSIRRQHEESKALPD
jgi:hypothetical protein